MIHSAKTSRTTLYHPAILIAALILLLGLTGCAGDTGAASSAQSDIASRKIRAVSTVGMINDLVRNIGGERVEAVGLMGPGIDPHLYKASAGDVQLLEKADIIFYGGLELEGRMTDIFVKIARTKPTVAVSESIAPERLREPPEFAGKYDPHIWFDVTLWMEAAKTVEKHLSELDPTHADLYAQNAAAYLKELEALHEYVTSQIETIPPESRVLVTAHDAFGYFGDQYGMEVHGLQGISTAAEAGAADVQGLAELIATRKIKAIFVESSVPHSTIEAVQAAVRARGWDVAIGGQLFSDAMGADGTPEGTYLGMVRHNVDTIAGALR